MADVGSYVIARNERYDKLESQRKELHELVETISRQLKGWIDALNNKAKAA